MKIKPDIQVGSILDSERFRTPLWLSASVFTLLAVQAQIGNARDDNGGQASPVHEITLLSESYLLDKKYASMLGPQSQRKFNLLESPEPELLWITSIEAKMVDGNDSSQDQPAFLMCHANVNFSDVTAMAVLNMYVLDKEFDHAAWKR